MPRVEANQLTLQLAKTYVYEGKPYQWTGKKAEKLNGRGALFEIVPLGTPEGTVGNFSKWVKATELYEVIENGH